MSCPLPLAYDPRRSLVRQAQAGFTVTEILIALSLVAVATLGSVSWTLSSVGLAERNDEEVDARRVMRRMLEELQTLPFEEVYARYNADPADDPLGVGTALGPLLSIEPDRKSGFLVRDLPLPLPTGGSIAYRARPIAASIEFPLGSDGLLSERPVNGDWAGRTYDLDGDGVLEDGSRATSHRILPVRIRLAWDTPQGPRSITHLRVLSKRVRAAGGS